MGLGRQGDQQGTMFLAYNEIPRSRGHAFYDRLQQILRRSGFDACAEKLRQPFHSGKGRPWIPPGRYFRMRLVGYSEGIDASARLRGGAPLRFPFCPPTASAEGKQKTHLRNGLLDRTPPAAQERALADSHEARSRKTGERNRFHDPTNDPTDDPTNDPTIFSK